MFALISTFLLTALFCYSCSAANISETYYPRYHLAPEYGWMNDPNGMCIFKGEYHMFYQYNPRSSQEPGIAHWAHAKSSDLIHWEHLPIAMYPDQSYDKGGVFSGSAIVENNTIYALYTGNINKPEKVPDHEQHQALAISTDGIKFTKYAGNPIIEAEKYQPNIRDPKVWKHGNTFYMVLGNSFNNNSLGRALLYTSKNLISWKFASVLDESDGSLGYMWECPDFFELGGKYVLLFSPQGMKPQGDKYKNKYQTGYIIGTFNYKTNLFTPITEFRELDHGHDFYATQTILDKSGKRIVMAWFDMWDNVYAERNDGWTGQMTVARTLKLSSDNRLLQKPVKQLSAARGAKMYSGKACPGFSIKFEDKAADIKVIAPKLQDFDVYIESSNVNVSIIYDYKSGKITFDRGGEDGIRRTKWRPEGKLIWQILIDASSIELFCGDGEVTFSSRFFPSDDVYFRIGDIAHAEELTIFEMKRTIAVTHGR